MAGTVRFGISLDGELLVSFDELLKKMGYDNRSEAVRDLIREKLVEEEWRAPKSETFAVVFLVYDHHTMSVNKRLTDVQHHSHDRIVSTLHVHIDEHNCLELVVLKGPGDEIRVIGDNLVGMRGVKYGKVTMGTTGRRLH